MNPPDFGACTDYAAPFPHFRVPALLSEQTAAILLDWFDADAPWRLKVADFYEQLEFSLLDSATPAAAAHVVTDDFVEAIAAQLVLRLGAPALSLVDVAAHRLIPGQTIRIHNDHIGADETHRVIVQLNRGWSVDQGGLFMIFANDDPDSVTDVLLPGHRSAFGFAISDSSHHAVSTIHAGNRDSLVYTFREAA